MSEATRNAPPAIDSGENSAVGPMQRLLGGLQNAALPAFSGRLLAKFLLDNDDDSDDAPRVTGKRMLSDGADEGEARKQQRQRREEDDEEEEGMEIEMIDEGNGEAIQLEREPLTPGEDESAAHHEEGATTQSTARSSPSIVIDAKLEEAFALVVLKHASRFRDTRPRRLVWQDIADESGGRFEDPNDVRMHTVRLCRIAANPRHLSHQALTPALRDFLLEVFEYWKAARCTEPRPVLGYPAHSTSSDGGGEIEGEQLVRHSLRQREQQLEPQLRHDEPALDVPRTEKSRGEKPVGETPPPIEIDCELEEAMARILLKHSRDFERGLKEKRVYQEIAGDLGGRFKNGEAVKQYTERLCAIAASPDHSQLTPMLRKMLLKFRSRTHGMVVHRKNDERLVELVLQLRPFSATGSKKPTIWTKIIRRLKSPLVKNSADGVRRVAFLTEIYADDTHAQHRKLTRKLRDLLEQYVRSFPRVTEKNPKQQGCATPSTSTSNASAQPTASKKREAASEVDQTSTATTTESAVADTRDQSRVEERSSRVPVVETRVIPSTTNSTGLNKSTTQVAALLASLKVQVATLQKEQGELREELRVQRDIREELRAQRDVREELRAQRESHHLETTAMIELMERERQDRKQEFSAMMAVIAQLTEASHAAAPASQGQRKRV